MIKKLLLVLTGILVCTGLGAQNLNLDEVFGRDPSDKTYSGKRNPNNVTQIGVKSIVVFTATKDLAFGRFDYYQDQIGLFIAGGLMSQLQNGASDFTEPDFDLDSVVVRNRKLIPQAMVSWATLYDGKFLVGIDVGSGAFGSGIAVMGSFGYEKNTGRDSRLVEPISLVFQGYFRVGYDASIAIKPKEFRSSVNGGVDEMFFNILGDIAQGENLSADEFEVLKRSKDLTKIGLTNEVPAGLAGSSFRAGPGSYVGVEWNPKIGYGVMETLTFKAGADVWYDLLAKNRPVKFGQVNIGVNGGIGIRF